MTTTESYVPTESKPRTIAGIVGLILAVVSLTLSWVPIVNNIAAVFALISAVLGAVGLYATRAAGKRSARSIAASAVAVSALSIGIVLATQAFYGNAINQVGKDVEKVVSGSVGSKPDAENPQAQADVVKFGSVVKYEDGSTLACSKPVVFTRAEYAAGGESSKFLMKARCTFTNRSGKTFNPVATSGSMSAGGEEGDSVYQNGLRTPSNPVLHGRSVSWSMGYGLQSTKDVQLTVRLGFLDYNKVTFT